MYNTAVFIKEPVRDEPVSRNESEKVQTDHALVTNTETTWRVHHGLVSAAPSIKHRAVIPQFILHG